MFTGIIATIGKVLANKNNHLRIEPLTPFADYQIGESIAINGVCLTVEKYSDTWFECYASTETLKITNLKKLTINNIVNLERALVVGGSLGGHFVSGHIDTLAKIKRKYPAGNSLVLHLTFPQEFSKFLVPKGSITLDGISLTINKCGSGFLEVNVIPETQNKTTISQWNIGYEINMETDMLGKYVYQNLTGANK